MNLLIQIGKILLGATEMRFNDKKYFVTQQDFNQGKSTKVLIGIIPIQNIWLFPILAACIDALQQGLTPAKTNHHFY